MKGATLLLFVAVSLVLLGVGLAITASGKGAGGLREYEVEGGDPEQGPRAVVKYGCGGCHQIAGIPTARGKVGPPLSSMGERAFIAGSLPNTPENLVLWIMEPQEVEPGTAMPDLRVTESDARSIAAYLYRLR